MRRTPGLVVAVATALAAASTLAPGATAAPASVSGYVVVLEDGAGPPAAVAERLADRYGGEVGFVYSHALRGFSIRTTDRAAAALASNPNVDYVEADGVMSVVDQTTPTGIGRIFAADADPRTTEAEDAYNASLGIDGIDDSRVDVDVAVIDTGIDLDHEDLNVVGSTNCTSESGSIFNRTVTCTDGAGDDDHYHGTHVAGTVAAVDNGLGVVGVAPGARLWAVKVLKSNGSGSNAMVIAGIDWVVKKGGIEVANMSLGGGYAQAVNDAVKNAVAKGVSMVVAAGNSAADAANYSPASEGTAITVSALADFNGLPGGGAASTCRSDVDDTFADFSNYGTVVDMIAPGVCILSTYPDNKYNTISGTSMASPHVAGAVALLRSMGKDQILAEDALIQSGNVDWTLGLGVSNDGEHERLLDVGDASVFKPKFVGDSTTDPGNAVPTASFTYNCTDLSCNFTDKSTDSDGSVAAWAWDFGDGATSTVQNPPSHTYSAGGTYTVKLTVTDDDGAPSTTSQQVTVTASDGNGGTTTLGFTPDSTSQGSTWTAIVNVVNGGSGVRYEGKWSSGADASCTTDDSGSCPIPMTWSGIHKKVSSVTWTPTGGEPVTVFKP